MSDTDSEDSDSDAAMGDEHVKGTHNSGVGHRVADFLVRDEVIDALTSSAYFSYASFKKDLVSFLGLAELRVTHPDKYGSDENYAKLVKSTLQ